MGGHNQCRATGHILTKNFFPEYLPSSSLYLIGWVITITTAHVMPPLSMWLDELKM